MKVANQLSSKPKSSAIYSSDLQRTFEIAQIITVNVENKRFEHTINKLSFKLIYIIIQTFLNFI